MRSRHAVALAAGLALALACQPDHRTREERANAQTLRSFAEAYNAQAPAWFEDYHAPEYEWEGSGVWAPGGRRVTYPEMLGMIEEEVRHFPDRRMQIRRLVVDGDQAALDYEWTGTAALDMGSVRKGEVQRWHNLLFVTLSRGKMVRAREYGVSPAEPGESGEPGGS